LCLCPNHHLLFDRGGFHVGEDLHLIGVDGSLRAKKGHSPSAAHLAYRRDHWGPLP
jgi:putative restriction endonuclease